MHQLLALTSLAAFLAVTFQAPAVGRGFAAAARGVETSAKGELDGSDAWGSGDVFDDAALPAAGPSVGQPPSDAPRPTHRPATTTPVVASNDARHARPPRSVSRPPHTLALGTNVRRLL